MSAGNIYGIPYTSKDSKLLQRKSKRKKKNEAIPASRLYRGEMLMVVFYVFAFNEHSGVRKYNRLQHVPVVRNCIF